MIEEKPDSFEFFKCRNCNTMFDGRPIDATASFHEDSRTAHVEFPCPTCGAELDCYVDIKSFSTSQP